MSRIVFIDTEVDPQTEKVSDYVNIPPKIEHYNRPS